MGMGTCGRVYSCCRKRADGSQDIVILSSSPDQHFTLFFSLLLIHPIHYNITIKYHQHQVIFCSAHRCTQLDRQSREPEKFHFCFYLNESWWCSSSFSNLTHEVCKTEAHHNGCQSTSDEAFPSLLWTQLDQWSAAHREAKHVGHDVVDDHHHDGHDEPDEPLEHVLNDEVALGDDAK